jgi:hypothetical protein
MRETFSTAVVRFVLLAIPMVFTPAAFAQTGGAPSTQSTAPPTNWVEQWTGMYGNQDQPGKQAPPGFKVLNPFNVMSAVIAPHLQPWALARRDATDFELEDPGMLCKPTGLFIVGAGGEGAFELLASPGKITLIARLIATGGVRRIYLDRPHLKNPPPTWNGDSVGHWEGDTLVIDSIGFNDKSWLSPDRARHSEELHIIERMRFVANGTYLEDKWTVDDPKALTSPFNLIRYHKKLPADTRMEGGACSEDSPEIRKAWLRMYKRAKQQAAADRAAASPPDSEK